MFVRALFGLTDFFAYTLCGLFLITALSAPFALPAYHAAQGSDIGTGAIASHVIALLLQAAGFFLLARRQSLGFIVIALSIAVAAAAIHANVLQLYYLLGVFAVFGTPWILGLKYTPQAESDS